MTSSGLDEPLHKEDSVLKKIGLVVAAAVAAGLALSPLAFAEDDNGYSGHSEEHKEQKCGEDILSGILTIPHNDNSENDSDDDVDCDNGDDDDDHDED